jgi:hypothetical protein
MPDGDIVHNRLRWVYQKPYKWLCEGKANSDECARVVLNALKKDLIRKGSLPVVLAHSMGSKLVQSVSSIGQHGSVDWAALSIAFDQLAQRADGRHDLKELALRAGKSVLRDLRYGQVVSVENAPNLILSRYMHEVYESEFKERVPLTPKHHAGIDSAALNQRINTIESIIRNATCQWADKAVRDRKIEKIQLPRRQHVQKVDMDEDLLAG